MSSKDSIVRDAVEVRLVFALIVLAALLMVQGCTAFNPQGAAIAAGAHLLQRRAVQPALARAEDAA